ncbi:MAG: DUF3883 domain-containing protein [Conexivisphaerales archaeon]
MTGQEVLVFQTGAEEIGKVPMVVTEVRKRFKKITERTLIDAYIKGGGAELIQIVRSIIAAKLALQDEIASKSVYYKAERRGRLEERLGLLGFRNVSELTGSVFSLFKSVSSYYGYKVLDSNETMLKVRQESGMPISISKVDEVIRLLDGGEERRSPTPILVSYGPEERTMFVYSIEVGAKGGISLFREPVGLSDDGRLFVGKSLLEELTRSVDNLIGATDSSTQRIQPIDRLSAVRAPNLAEGSARKLLDPLEEYVKTLTGMGLRNVKDSFVKQEDVEARVAAEPLGVVTFVKKPLVSFEEIPREQREEAERRAVEVAMKIEREEGRIPREIPAAEQVTKHYDILSVDPVAKTERLIEVKGHMGPEVYGELTDDEGAVAQTEGSRYWLYIVYNIKVGSKLLRFRDPFSSMNYEIIEKVTKEKRYILWPRAV